MSCDITKGHITHKVLLFPWESVSDLRLQLATGLICSNAQVHRDDTHTHTWEFSTSTRVYTAPNRLCTQMHHKRYQVCQCVSHCTTVKMNGTGFSYAYQLENWLKTLPTFLLQGEREASSILSRWLLAGAAPLYCANIPPYQCFRGCCTPHKSHGM